MSPPCLLIHYFITIFCIFLTIHPSLLIQNILLASYSLMLFNCTVSSKARCRSLHQHKISTLIFFYSSVLWILHRRQITFELNRSKQSVNIWTCTLYQWLGIFEYFILRKETAFIYWFEVLKAVLLRIRSSWILRCVAGWVLPWRTVSSILIHVYFIILYTRGLLECPYNEGLGDDSGLSNT